MAKTKITFLVSVTCLIFSLIFSSPSSSSSSPQFHILDVSSSLQRTRDVFSHRPFNQTPRLKSSLSSSSNNQTLSLNLHPRSALPDFMKNNNNNNYSQLTLSRLARDMARVNSIMSTHSRALSGSYRPEKLESPVISGRQYQSGEYFARIGVGTPTKEYYMVIDTGSDITWLQCKPCSNCYNQSDPIYEPAESTTFKNLTCDSPECSSLPDNCNEERLICSYGALYGDGSYTTGELVTETISFNMPGTVPNVAIGCGHDNEGLFVAAAGLLGLGRGDLSLPSQINATSFSYCLLNPDSKFSSTLDFNPDPPFFRSVQAPLLVNDIVKTFYYVDLTGITVNGAPLDIPSHLFEIDGDGNGGVIIDSGTTVTRFPTDAYELFRNAFVDAFSNMTTDLVRVEKFSIFDTCYNLPPTKNVSVPTVSFQFGLGASLQLSGSNYLIPVDDKGKFCFAFRATTEPMSIIGNVQQQGMRVHYDLANKHITISPRMCEY